MMKCSMEKQTWLKLIFWPVLAFMYGAILWNYFFTQTSTALSADLWRYIPIIESYYNSGFSPSILLLKHGEHLQLAYNLWFLINSLFFDLNTRLELFIGIIFLFGVLFVLYRIVIHSIHEDVPLLQKRLAFLIIAAIVLSFHQIRIFTYCLLAFVSFGEMLFMLIFLIVFDRILINNQQDNIISWIILTGVFYLLGAGFAGGGWVCYSAAAIPIVFAWQVTRHIELKQVVGVYLGLLAISIPVFLTFSLVPERSISGSALNAFSYLLEHTGDALQYLVMLLANSVVNINTLENRGFASLIAPIGFLVLCFQAYSIYLFFRVGIWKKTYIPLYLLVLFWTIALALLFFRFPVFGISNAAAPRYATTLQLGTIGAVWVLIVALLSWKNGFKWVGVSALTMGVMAMYIFHLVAAFHAAPYYQKAARNDIELIRNELFDKWSVACPHKELCEEGVKVLKEHKLNAFK